MADVQGGVSYPRAEESTSLGSVSVLSENVESVHVENLENHRVVTPLRGSYASAARDPNAPHVTANVDPENALPSQPLSVYFQPRYFLPARDVFEALSAVDLTKVLVVLF